MIVRFTGVLLFSGLGFAAGWTAHQRWAVAEAAPGEQAQPAPNWQQTWDEALRLPHEYARSERLRAIVAEWAEESPSAALSGVQRLTDGSERWILISEAVAGWARKAPQEAVDWVLKLEPSQRRERALTSALTQLAAKDPTAAVALAGQLPERERSDALRRSLVRWAEKDLPSAMQYLERLPDGKLQERITLDIAADYAGRDADAAITWASALPAPQSQGALRRILDSLIRHDPVRAARMLAILEEGSERKAAARDVAFHWAGSDAPAALSWAFEEPVAEDRTALIEAVFKRWCEYDAPAASRRLAELQEPAVRDAAAIAIAANQYAPLALAQQAHQMILDEGVRRKISGLLYNRMDGYGYDAALLERYRQEAGYEPRDRGQETYREHF